MTDVLAQRGLGGDTPEDERSGKTASVAAGEDAARVGARRVQTRHGLAVRSQHPGALVDAQAPDRVRNCRTDPDGDERRLDQLG